MEKLLPWFVLKSVPGIGAHLFKLLLDHFLTPENVLNSSLDELITVAGINRKLAFSILHHKISDEVKRDFSMVMEKGYRIITITDSDYPYLLRQIYDPPPFLYVAGNLDSSIKNISVVGSRSATAYGMVTAKRLCADLALCGITVVSGMARGIDTAAHVGALSSEGRTIAVLGSGLENIYPIENKALFADITQNGSVISEFPLLTKPLGYNFPKRNRIISGIALGTVIVEATKKSGSLITARFAAEQNREVFAVPGNINSYKSSGAHNLIKQGAKLVENAKDILEEISNIIEFHEQDNNSESEDEVLSLSSEEKMVFDNLNSYPVQMDELIRNISITPGQLSSVLLKLELKGLILQLPGKLFSKKN